MVVIEPIRARGALVAQLADGFGDEWPAWCRTLSRERLEAGFLSDGGGGLPVVLVAHEQGRALGTVALRRWFGDEPMELTPWVRGFYVAPSHRGLGIDGFLLHAVEQEAYARGFRTLHGATTRIEPLALRRGWEVFHRLTHDGEPMAWLRRAIG